MFARFFTRTTQLARTHPLVWLAAVLVLAAAGLGVTAALLGDPEVASAAFMVAACGGTLATLVLRDLIIAAVTGIGSEE